MNQSLGMNEVPTPARSNLATGDGPFEKLEALADDLLSEFSTKPMSPASAQAFHRLSAKLACCVVRQGQPLRQGLVPLEPLKRNLKVTVPGKRLEDLKDLRDMLTRVIDLAETSKQAEQPDDDSWDAKFVEIERYVEQNPEPIISTERLSCLEHFMVLDNSLRETTVGAIRGHTLKEKEAILDEILKTGVEEKIIGVFGQRETVDTQVPEQWKKRGIPFDRAWGFVGAYDFCDVDLEGFVRDAKSTKSRRYSQPDKPDFVPRATYTDEDIEYLQRMGVKDFGDSYSEYEHDHGRIPRGLFEMAHYGVPNVILEVDFAVAGFDYEIYDVISHLKRLLCFVRDNFNRRKLSSGETAGPRVLVNLRDFSAYHHEFEGFSRALRAVDALCRLPENERVFGFIMEEPTSLHFPDQLARLVRMTRLTINRAGHVDARFLVHIHRGFDLAEANVLACLSNGADGVWAAVCRTGANAGHAASSVTLVNLHRAGNKAIAEKYNLAAFMEAARRVTQISTRAPCSPDEETYGTEGFDIPYAMAQAHWCRFLLADLVQEIGVKRRIRINEFSHPDLVYAAMVERFGEPQENGWDPLACDEMSRLITRHLVDGKCLEYNTTPGLALLYHKASGLFVPQEIIQAMIKSSGISAMHPLLVSVRRRCYELSRAVKEHPEWYPVDLTTRTSEELLGLAPSFLWKDVHELEPAPEKMSEIELPFHALFLDQLRSLAPGSRDHLDLERMHTAARIQATRLLRFEDEKLTLTADRLLGMCHWGLAQHEEVATVEELAYNVVMGVQWNFIGTSSPNVVTPRQTKEQDREGTKENMLAFLRQKQNIPPGFDTPVNRQQEQLKRQVRDIFEGDDTLYQDLA